MNNGERNNTKSGPGICLNALQKVNDSVFVVRYLKLYFLFIYFFTSCFLSVRWKCNFGEIRGGGWVQGFGGRWDTAWKVSIRLVCEAELWADRCIYHLSLIAGAHSSSPSQYLKCHRLYPLALSLSPFLTRSSLTQNEFLVRRCQGLFTCCHLKHFSKSGKGSLELHLTVFLWLVFLYL